ncbi:MAG: type II toxin-antitoxin system RelB/DinJ family antitoxin [Lachnospiraceae bacterium]|nr:type II toxin-antitoxin system RelB/DinJ family antitoxin [Lachnospiraceae bacterium]
MAAKTANVLARVEPEVKEEAERIMSQLGIPASVVINMLYKQIIITKSIPFPLSVAKVPMTRDAMDKNDFDAMMARGLAQAKADESRPAADVISDIKRDIREWAR